MGTIYSRLSKTMKKIFVSTLGFSLICMAFSALVMQDIIRVSDEVGVTVLGIGLTPLLIFSLIITRRKKVKRRAFSKDIKEKVLRRQNYLCNICRGSAENWDFDHMGSRGDNSAKNCQALCLDCHREKTIRESRQSKK